VAERTGESLFPGLKGYQPVIRDDDNQVEVGVLIGASGREGTDKERRCDAVIRIAGGNKTVDDRLQRGRQVQRFQSPG
jgi:hypothetical protein